MEDKKIRKLHIVHNCGECIFHEKIELSKTHLGAFYLDYCHSTGLYSNDSAKLFKYCNLPDYER